MNLLSKCNNTQVKLIRNPGVKLEDKDYSREELKNYEMQMIDFIMSHSSKNGEIDKLRNDYINIFNIIENN